MSSGEKKDGNPFLDFAWQAIADIPAIYLGGWLADKIGRRYSGVTSLGVLGLTWACIGFRENSKSVYYLVLSIYIDYTLLVYLYYI